LYDSISKRQLGVADKTMPSEEVSFVKKAAVCKTYVPYEPHFYGSRDYSTKNVILSFAGGSLPNCFADMEKFVDAPENDCSMACVFNGGVGLNIDDDIHDGQHSRQFNARYMGSAKKIGRDNEVDASLCSICCKYNSWMDQQGDSINLVRWKGCRWVDIWWANIERVRAHAMGSNGLLDEKKRYFIIEGSNRGAGMSFERNYIRNLVRQHKIPAPIVITAQQLTDFLPIPFGVNADDEISALNEDRQLKKRVLAEKEFGMLRPKKTKAVDKDEEKLIQLAFQSKKNNLIKVATQCNSYSTDHRLVGSRLSVIKHPRFTQLHLTCFDSTYCYLLSISSLARCSRAFLLYRTSMCIHCPSQKMSTCFCVTFSTPRTVWTRRMGGRIIPDGTHWKRATRARWICSEWSSSKETSWKSI
jgi:hypothetical protein